MYIIMYNCNLEDVLQNLSCLYCLEIKPETSSWVLLKYSVTVREKGGTTGTRARTLPNQEALGPEIEEGAVNRRPLQVLFLLPQGGAGPATAPAPSSYRYCYVGRLAN